MNIEKKQSGIIMPKFTLPDSRSKGTSELEQLQAQRMPSQPLPASQTQFRSKGTSELEQLRPQRMPSQPLPASQTQFRSKGTSELEQLQTQRMPSQPLPASQTQFRSKGTSELEQLRPQRMPSQPQIRQEQLQLQQVRKIYHAPFIQDIGSMITIDNPMPLASQFLEIEDDDAFIVETVSVNAVEKIGAKEKAGTLLGSLTLLFSSILFFGVFAILIFEIPILTYKVTAMIIFFIAFSYIASACMRRFDRAHYKSLTTTQIIRAIRKEPAPKGDKDMEHLKLIKQDTTGYLRAITKKVIR